MNSTTININELKTVTKFNGGFSIELETDKFDSIIMRLKGWQINHFVENEINSIKFYHQQDAFALLQNQSIAIYNTDNKNFHAGCLYEPKGEEKAIFTKVNNKLNAVMYWDNVVNTDGTGKTLPTFHSQINSTNKTKQVHNLSFEDDIYLVFNFDGFYFTSLENNTYNSFFREPLNQS